MGNVLRISGDMFLDAEVVFVQTPEVVFMRYAPPSFSSVDVCAWLTHLMTDEIVLSNVARVNDLLRHWVTPQPPSGAAPSHWGRSPLFSGMQAASALCHGRGSDCGPMEEDPTRLRRSGVLAACVAQERGGDAASTVQNDAVIGTGSSSADCAD